MKAARFFAGPMSQFGRRSLIVLLLVNLGMVLGIVAGMFSPLFAWWFFMPGFSPHWLWLVLLLPFALLLRLHLATGGLAFKADLALDERERALRDQATQVSYRLLSRAVLVLIALTALLLFIGPAFPPLWAWRGGMGPAVVTTGIWPLLLLVLAKAAALVVALPTLVVAWLEPDPVREESFAAKERARADAS
jgi:MFS family permease